MSARSEHSALIYDRSDNLEGGDSLSEIARRIPPAATVLDLGAATGALGRRLSSAGCTVDGVERDSQAAAQARPFYRQLLEIDLEVADLREHLPAEAYDVVVCADVLEHLRDPGRVLDQIRTLLAPEGRTLLSIPNVAYAGVVAGLLAGEFRYRPIGLLDETHLRFFTRSSLIQMLREHGYRVSSISAIEADPQKTEFRDERLDALAPAVVRALLSHPDALAYQFIVEAVPGLGIDASPLPSRPALRFECQLFWSSDGQFSETGSSTGTGLIGEERQTIELAIPPLPGPPRKLRFDPADRPGFLTIHSIQLRDCAGGVVWSWDGNPATLQGFHDLVAFRGPFAARWLATSDDPWCELPVPPAALAAIAGGGNLVVETSWPMSSDHAFASEVLGQYARQWETERSGLLRQVQSVSEHSLTLERRIQELTSTIAAQTTPALQHLDQRVSALESKGNRFAHARREAFPRKVDFNLVPARDIEKVDDGGWQATSANPCFTLEPGSRPHPTGWTAIEIELEHSLDTAVPPILYVDDGSGFTEASALRLPMPVGGMIRTLVKLPPRVSGFRFYPVDVPGRFRLRRVVMRELGKVRASLQLAAPSAFALAKEPTRIPAAMAKAIGLLRTDGLRGLKHWLREKAQAQSGQGSYADWIEQFDRLTPTDRAAIARRIEAMPQRPRFSILLPVFQTPERFLRRAIESVREQLYPDWELCIVDDASAQPHVRAVLEQFAKLDPRVKVTYHGENQHISAASNSALDLATGDFLALLDHDDELAPHALYLIAEELNAHPDTDVLFSDEDKIDEHGRRFEPFFKPGWNPDLLLSQNCVSHLGIYRRSLMLELGGFRRGLEGSQDHDLVLRCLARTGRIRHLPFVLYHWRSHAESTAAGGGAKGYAHAAGERALRDFLAGRAEVRPGPFPTTYRVRWPVPNPAPLASIIVATRDGGAKLERCLDSVFARTDYPAFEVVAVDNQSVDPRTLDYLERLRRERGVRILRHDSPFNFSAINNRAAREARGGVLVLLNDDTEVIAGEWLRELVSQAIRPDVGAVGARLLYPDGTVQHAGIVVGLFGIAGHVHRRIPRDAIGYFTRARLVLNVSAVTAACLAVRKELYQQVGGLDEENLPVAFNDVDFCLRLQSRGLHNVYTPYAELFHHEHASRGGDDTAAKRERFRRESEFMVRRWARELRNDPHWNPNLSLNSEQADLAWPPRVERPWRESDPERHTDLESGAVTVSLPTAQDSDYRAWLALHTPTPQDLQRQKSALVSPPRIDVVIARGTGDEAARARTVASLHAQSLAPHAVLETAPAVSRADAINQAVRGARGDLLVFLDSGDELAPHALFSLAKEAEGADLVYGDEDRLRGSSLERPFFKPGWSPDALLSSDYTGGPKLLRRDLFKEAGGFRDLPGAEEHDLLLRLLPRLSVRHVPDILLHRAAAPEQAGGDVRRQVLAEHVSRALGSDYCVDDRLRILYKPTVSPRVAVIVPTRDRADLLAALLRSLDARPSHAQPDLIVVDNGSTEPATRSLLAQLARRPGNQVLRYPREFNWSAINNFAVTRTDAEYLLFLNNDVEALEPGWIDAMLAFATRPEIGMVGAQLLYPEGTLQHYGVVIGLTGYAGHLLAGCRPDEQTPAGPTDLIRNCSAVTGACMLMRRAVFDRVGGFDERFLLCGSDVAICLRALDEGLRHVVTPQARLLHHESKTRGTEIPRSDFRHSFEAYEKWLRAGDPYYSPQLSLKTTRPRLRLEPEDMVSFARSFL